MTIKYSLFFPLSRRPRGLERRRPGGLRGVQPVPAPTEGQEQTRAAPAAPAETTAGEGAAATAAAATAATAPGGFCSLGGGRRGGVRRGAGRPGQGKGRKPAF